MVPILYTILNKINLNLFSLYYPGLYYNYNNNIIALYYN